MSLVTSPDGLLTHASNEKPDVILLAGWSWKVPDNILNSSYVVGLHPSDLPAYAGGSPIQNQILDGIEETNASLFKLTSSFDAGPILDKRRFSLKGHMSDIFNELTRVTIEMFASFIVSYPHVTETPQPQGGNKVRRLKPEQSRLEKHDIPNMTCVELWDRIRCREDPYPNVFIEDETGRLYFKLVEFEKR